MAQLFEAQPDNDLPDVPNYNVCPTNSVHSVMLSDTGARRLTSMRWGFLPKWYKKTNGGPLLINARGETIAEKPAFREAVRARRCLVPATGFYEWTKTADGSRDPWYVSMSDETPLVMAAIWQDWHGPDGETLRTCAVVTTAANQAMSPIHHRMPVILKPEEWALWLGQEGHGAARLMVAVPDDVLTVYRVDRAVNSNRAVGKALTDPLQT